MVIYSSVGTKSVQEKKSIISVFGTDRQICPLGHCLASRGSYSLTSATPGAPKYQRLTSSFMTILAEEQIRCISDDI